ncbi:kinase-like domain-containing protein [Glomus cerebriforme]|uniref:Kinase-like domain-containing protein n=1 Tax=Glomus cerebriforme TaxID=658196 RepID=A0A397TAE1_9GLOM|nr:kinase-like domain-containing protein [Glomus cerebriforme]
MHKNLREYLQQNHNKLTWKDRIKITNDIIYSLRNIHYENAIHRDLHSGNVLFCQIIQKFRISDLGFCGPADKPLNSIYGNLPYIAPEVIAGKITTFASDIYSIGMLMWEITSGQPPFINKHNFDLAMRIMNGMRPKIVTGTPLEYKKLMEQCWNADPTERPNINDLKNKMHEINKSYYQKELPKINTSIEIKELSSIDETNYTSTSRLFTSKVYQFKNLPEPRNATEGMYNIYK